MKLTKQDIKENCAEWLQKGFILPEYDMDEMGKKTEKAPEWIHFGAGNIFRAYIARIADDLLKAGEMETGIIAVNNYDSESIERIYKPCDCLTLLVGLRAKGNRYYRVLGSVAKALAAKGNGLEELLKMAEKESLKMISYTITEKGYAVKDVSGKILPPIEKDIKEGPDGNLDTVIGKTAAMLNKRYKANGVPISLVSMDNCSHNGEKLKEGVSLVIEKWAEAGLVEEGLREYLAEKVAFPCSMIDKITPRPAETVAKELKKLGVEDMELIVTKKGTYTSAYVNAEMPQYLVIEDCFPNGRAALEKAGVYITDLETVEKAEKMKVTVCLNPLHTALAVFGCLLGYNKISDEIGNDILDLINSRIYSKKDNTGKSIALEKNKSIKMLDKGNSQKINDRYSSFNQQTFSCDSPILKMTKSNIILGNNNINNENETDVTLKDFISLINLRMKNVESEEELMEMFKIFDKKGTGKVSSGDIRAVLDDIDEPISQQELEDLMLNWDKDKDGFLNYFEFKEMMSNV